MILHKSVMLDEVLEYLEVKENEWYIDATLGAGGYTEAILQKGGKVLGIDQDPKAIMEAQKRLSACPGVFKLVHANFSQLSEIASKENIGSVAGIVFDLGFASFQVDDPERGLSFQKDGPLDMRLDPRLGVTAADLVNSLSEKQLSQLFTEFGEEKLSRRIAKSIVEKRTEKQFEQTQELVELIENVYMNTKTKLKINPATKVFQALRIAVNSEFDNLISALPQAFSLLKNQGRLVVVSFHSGEDRIVKNFFKEQESLNFAKVLTPKPIIPSSQEIEQNPRSRSAKLRAVEKV